jgi:hypothetical protein
MKDILLSFLKKIKEKSDIIKKKNNSNYSLLCCTLLSFYNNGKFVMDKKSLYESVKKEIEDNENKVISSFANNCKYPETINTKSYTSKLNMLLANTRCFELLDDNQIKLNEEYIIKKRQRIYNYSFNTNLIKNKLGIKRRIFKRIKRSCNRKIIDETKINIKTNSKKKNTTNENVLKSSNCKEEDDHFIDIEIEDMNDFESTEQISQDNNYINIKGKEEESIEDKPSLKDENITPIKDKKSKDFNKNKIDCLITPKFVCKNNKININQGKIIKDNLSIKLFCFIQKAEEFLHLTLNEKFNDSLKNDSRPGIQILVNYINEINLINYIKNAKNDYFELKKYCESWKSIDYCSSKSKILNLIKKCRLLVYAIITRLSLFILDFDFFQEIINNNLEKYNVFKVVKKYMDENKKILNHEYINELEKLFENNFNSLFI